jgi:hypothetical protein
MNRDEAVCLEKVQQFIQKPVRAVVDKSQDVINYEGARTALKKVFGHYDAASFLI